MASQARFLLQFLDTVATGGSDSSSRHLQEDFTPEDVDLSEAGWSTDFACAVLGLCFVITSYTSYDSSSFHFMYMHLGTFIAHLFGGFAHALYPNRASDGVGMVGFYVTIGIGYLGNCMRYGWGWGLPTCWKVVALMNMTWLIVAAVFAIIKMEQTDERRNDGAESDPDDPFKPDTFFGFGELICAIMEILASIYYVVRVDKSFYAIVASGSNLAGWVSVYALGLYAAGTGFEYDTRITQLIFHYAMIVFLWAINELALRKSCNDGGNASSKKQQRIDSSGSEVEDA